MNKTENKKRKKKRNNLWSYVKAAGIIVLAEIGLASCDVAINPVDGCFNLRQGLDPVGLYLGKYEGKTQEGSVEKRISMLGYKITETENKGPALGGKEFPMITGGTNQEQKYYYIDFLFKQTQYNSITKKEENKYIYFIVDETPYEEKENEISTKNINKFFEKNKIDPSKRLTVHIEVFDNRLGLEEILDDVEEGLLSAGIELNENYRTEVINYLKDYYN